MINAVSQAYMARVYAVCYRLWYDAISRRRNDIPGIPAYLMRRLQSALNAAARLVFHLRRCDHITDALVSLHWLHVPERIQFIIAVLTYRVLHGNAPRYLGPLTSTVDVPGRRALHSAGTNRLVVPTDSSQTGYRRQPSFSGRRCPHL